MKLITILILILGTCFLFGCTSSSNPQTQNQTPVLAPPSCSDYCASQPQLNCTGNWNSSGIYPNCDCQFICQQSAPNQNISTTIAVPNATMVDQTQNASVSAPAPQTTPTAFYPSIDDALGQEMLNEKINFFATAGNGNYQETDVTWDLYNLSTNETNGTATQVSFGQIEQNGPLLAFGRSPNESDVLGFGLLNFTENNYTAFQRGVILVDNESVGLETNPTFGINYMNYELRVCNVENKDDIMVEMDRIRVYHYSCESIALMN